jgi:predicted nucleic acid-binding protein
MSLRQQGRRGRRHLGDRGDRVWELRDDNTAYDACYIALAELLRAPLLTCDARMARSTGARCAFEVH